MMVCIKSGVVTLQTHARGQQITAFSSYCWPKPILKHITVPFTVTCLSLHQEMFKNNSFMIPEKSNTFLIEAHELTFLGCGKFLCYPSELVCLLYGVKRCM